VLFILDHNVDRAVCKLLGRRGHRCVAAGELGLATAKDNDLAVYADNKHAVFISHDEEFADRQRDNTFGHHVYLSCAEPRALDVLGQHLDEVIELVQSRDAIVIRVSQDVVKPYPRGWV
jgi:predicted nuclease of predicted toxin-antitoxin system